MNKFDAINQDYLLNEQYKDAFNFNTRLHAIQQLSTQPVDWYPWIFGLIKKPPQSRVLELGCGPGYLWQKNLAHIPPNWDITLSDFSPGMLKEAQNNLSQSDHHFSFQVIDAQHIPFEAASFDILIANLMLYHVPDRARAFSEIRRVLKADGTFYAATVTAMAFTALENLIITAGMLPWENVSGFSLEDGEEQIAHWFSQIKLQRLENTLVVAEAAPLLAFIRSVTPQDQYNEATFQRLRELIEREISLHGDIRISMDIGLFEACGRKP